MIMRKPKKVLTVKSSNEVVHRKRNARNELSMKSNLFSNIIPIWDKPDYHTHNVHNSMKKVMHNRNQTHSGMGRHK